MSVLLEFFMVLGTFHQMQLENFTEFFCTKVFLWTELIKRVETIPGVFQQHFPIHQNVCIPSNLVYVTS